MLIKTYTYLPNPMKITSDTTPIDTPIFQFLLDLSLLLLLSSSNGSFVVLSVVLSDVISSVLSGVICVVLIGSSDNKIKIEPCV